MAVWFPVHSEKNGVWGHWTKWKGSFMCSHEMENMMRQPFGSGNQRVTVDANWHKRSIKILVFVPKTVWLNVGRCQHILLPVASVTNKHPLNLLKTTGWETWSGFACRVQMKNMWLRILDTHPYPHVFSTTQTTHKTWQIIRMFPWLPRSSENTSCPVFSLRDLCLIKPY